MVLLKEVLLRKVLGKTVPGNKVLVAMVLVKNVFASDCPVYIRPREDRDIPIKAA